MNINLIFAIALAFAVPAFLFRAVDFIQNIIEANRFGAQMKAEMKKRRE